MISFDFIFNTVKQPIFLLLRNLDKEYHIINANKAALELVKYDITELTKTSPVTLGLIADEKQWNDLSDRLKHQESYSYLSSLNTKIQQDISSELTVYRYADKENEYILIYQRNTGNQQKVLEALRQSEYRFLQMTESIVEGLIINENGKAVFVNSSMNKITGFTKEELKDMDGFHLARKDERERINAFREKIKKTTYGVQVIEFWIVVKSGQQKFIRQSFTFSQPKSGKKSTYIVVSDISDRKRIEQALRKSQGEFQMLAENSPDLITRYNKNLSYSYANKAAQKIIGIDGNPFIGLSNMEVFNDRELAIFIEEMHLEVFRTGRNMKFEFRLNTVNNTIKVFQANMVPELSKQGTVESVLNMARDITQIKQVEKALTDEKQFLISENRLLSTNLKRWCDIICEKNENTDAKDCLNPIISIADYAQYGYEQQKYSPKPFNLNNFFTELHASINQKHIKDNIELKLSLPEHQLSIYSDQSFLKKVINLLYINAIEATSEGKIEIGFDIYNEKEIVCFVKDTGKGIQPDDTENIFEPFTSIDKDGHAGLGLSIADKFVETLGGQLWCLSSIGTGSTFCFTHPAEIEKAMLQKKSEDVAGKWKDKRILIVEDTDNNFLLLETILQKYEPKIERAIYGKDAITMAKDGAFDFILMDIQLPDTNGYEVTQEIRKFNKSVPIVAQTAYAMYDNVVKALDSGCNDFIAKPIKAKKLYNIIEKLMID